MDRRQGGSEDGDDRARREKEQAISDLALRYRSGGRDALGSLYSLLEPFIHSVLRPYLEYPRSLPVILELEDLHQQAYVALAEAALEWQPDRNASFVPYFFRSFPWRIDHYLRSHTPARRTARFRLLSVPHDSLAKRADGLAGPDGRDWDDTLACSELLRGLPKPYARVVEMHLFQGFSLSEVALSLGLGRSAVYETFGRALSLLRSRLELPPGPSPRRVAIADGDDLDPALLRRCVEVLHRLAPDGAPIPGREQLCREVGLTWQEHRKIMERLCDSGCVVGRRLGSSGCLACAEPEETMRLLGNGA